MVVRCPPALGRMAVTVEPELVFVVVVALLLAWTILRLIQWA